MNRTTRKVVIVGGGTAGWITANVVACECRHGDCEVVVVESPDIPTIGVGEGTWPSMRTTLRRVGLAEDEFIRNTDASFKQGTRFFGWSGRLDRDEYCHPFSLPVEYASLNPARFWLAARAKTPFAELVTPQAAIMQRGLAPKQITTPPYAFAFNYAYHLDAAKFAALLHRQAMAAGVAHSIGNVEQIEARADGDIAAVVLDTGERVQGDLFVDCTGQRALLLGGHFGVPLVSVKQHLFNDTAIAVQVPYPSPDGPIASATHATAQPAGWIWDIGLQGRRGVGYVHSSAHVDGDAALATLEGYLADTSPGIDVAALTFRTIPFEPGYRTTFWSRNCVAVGLSAGFVEPLEASALALIEQSAAMIAEQLPRDRRIMEVTAKRFNAKMEHHWQRIVEFLKLHYVTSVREDEYWRDNRNPGSCPDGLRDKLTVWEQQPPWHDDAPRLDELFPSASYQYVLYGMGFRAKYDPGTAAGDSERERADRVFQDVRAKSEQALRLLPDNRSLLCSIVQREQEREGHG
ncbi:MAG: tryptophan 7-halogenase [Gammaproteobacteria bacterium]|nr:tryptophan 7-halogenase [Gammaproteobacteria bacterium]